MATTPGPGGFVLFGGTRGPPRRLGLPGLSTLGIEGLLREQWVLTGTGRGDVSHEDFRQRVRESLTEFGPAPSKGPWREFASRLRCAGGGFDSDDPGSLLDVIDEARKEFGGESQ